MAAPPNQWLHEKTINFIARITPHCHDVTRLLSQSMDRRFTATRAIIDTAAFRNLRLVPTVQSATRDHTQVEPFYSVRPGTGLDSIAFRGCSKANERHDKANSAIRRQVAGDFGDNWSVFLDVMILSTARLINYMTRALREHWVEYLLEAAELGLFMVSAGLFTALLEYPASPVHRAIQDDLVRRAIIGVVMGLTAIAIIYSPLGKRSGAHMNPAVTLTFLRLGKVKAWDAFYYILAQFIGGLSGILLTTGLIHEALADPSVNYVVTAPGQAGEWIAFAAEFVIAFGLMLTVLFIGNMPGLSMWTRVCAGGLVTIYIMIEAPLSGMSMNPARTLSSAIVASFWTGLWIYFVAPVLAMQLAAEIYVRTKRVVYCAKLYHHNNARCIFNCRFSELWERECK